jgi:hypothetical protein
MEKENNTKCPICDWEPPTFKGVYYRFDKENRLRQDLSDFQLKEKQLIVPKNYYPKFINVVEHNTLVGKGFIWVETHLCKNCKKEFSFENTNIKKPEKNDARR